MRTFMLAAAAVFLFLAISSSAAAVISPYIYLDGANYQFIANATNPHPEDGSIQGATEINNGEDFAFLWHNGKVRFYHESELDKVRGSWNFSAGTGMINHYKEFRTLANPGTGIAEIPPGLWPGEYDYQICNGSATCENATGFTWGDIVVSDTDSLWFYTKDGTFRSRMYVFTPYDIRDIAYDKQFNKFFATAYTSGDIYLRVLVRNDKYLTLTAMRYCEPGSTIFCQGDPMGQASALKILYMEKYPNQTNNMLISGYNAKQMELDGNYNRDTPNSIATNLATGTGYISGMAYTNHYSVETVFGPSPKGFYLYFGGYDPGAQNPSNVTRFTAHLEKNSSYPYVRAVSPPDGQNETANGAVALVYFANYSKALDYCSLLVNGSVVMTAYGIAPGANNTFSYQFANGLHNWSINCSADGKVGYTETRLLFVGAPTWILHLTGMPSYLKESANYSGAATAAMILNYERIATGNSTLTQSEVFNYGRANMLPANIKLGDFDPKAMMYALGHFDPYDGTDPTGYGNSYKGYNYDIDSYNAADPNAQYLYMRDILHWMAWSVPREYWWLGGELTAAPNAPAAIPLYGNYNHWVAVNGGVASENPTPVNTDPFNMTNVTVYGFWLTDPDSGGIGQQTYATAQECINTYFKPVVSNDQYNGTYVQVAEPPKNKSNLKLIIGGRKSNYDTDQLEDIVSDDNALSEIGGTDMVNAYFSDAGSKAVVLKAKSVSLASPKTKAARFKKINWSNVIDPVLLKDQSFQNAYQGTEARMPIKVRRTDTNDYYFIVPFGKKKGYASVTVMVDSTKALFRQASWVGSEVKYLAVDKKKALSLAGFKGKAQAELVWEPNKYSSSPFRPYWKITTGARAVFVTQDGQLHALN